MNNKTLDINVENNSTTEIGICRKCHWLCDDRYSCNGSGLFDCFKCAFVAIQHNDTLIVSYLITKI